MGKRKERKMKRKMEEKASRVPLPDLFDDEHREQVEPFPEPMVEQQDEEWAYQAGDPRPTVSTRSPGEPDLRGE